MLDSTVIKDIRTSGFVLRRTNYGEADRILNIITPQGKFAVIAKGARREKSKLAGGIEMFSLADFNIHFGKGELGILTSAKMLRHYSNILKDLDKLELAGFFLKKINNASEHTDSEEYFNILEQSLEGLDEDIDRNLVEAWFLLNIVRALSEEINFYRDKDGDKLREGCNYMWDVNESAFSEISDGNYGTNEIKVLRLMVTTKLKVINKIKIEREKYIEILRLARMVSKI